MRRYLIAGTVASLLTVAPAIAHASPEQSPPTTVETSTVERRTTVTTISELDKDNDDDSSNAGLWGLLGLLGLVGLAGLAGRRRHEDTGATPSGGTPVTSVAPPKAEGATGTKAP